MIDIDVLGQLIPNPLTMLVQLCSTLVLFLLAKKFLWPSVQAYLGKRSEKMQSDLEVSEQAKQEALSDRQKALNQLNEASDKAEQIRENISFISNTMKRNRELIAKLRQQARESSVKSEQMKQTIENLVSQLEEKNAQLQQLRAELDAKDIHIAELNENINNLNTNVTNLQTENNEKSQTINTQDKQLHTAWYVFGTKKELKDQRILEGDRVLQANFNKSYFTKIDIRVDKEIKLYSKSAKILTSHPSGAYTLQRDANKQYVLRITDPQTFWSTSKYLVIQVN
jgi:F0F1-type ATP synthase membrane subunit b/b'